MNKIFISALVALSVSACSPSTSNKETIESSQSQEPIAETTPVSRTVEEVIPSPIPTLKAASEPKLIKPVVKSVKPSPTAIQTASETNSIVKPVANSTVASEKPVSVNKLVKNISSNIGCGKVNENYKIKVATVAIAEYNPQSLQGLSKNQIKQAVKQSIAEYPERVDGLVAEYRSSNCAIAKNPPVAEKSVAVDNNRVPTSSGEVIPSQSGSCKQLKAQGIKNISVAANPWASRLDRDNDGIACESK